jgi:RHS repeat-associated protein
VSDSKIGVPNGSGGISYYIAEVLSQNEYYPFGMGMVGRSYSTGGYRYGFNGKENDNEVKGEGNQQDYGMRIYDTRLGKFLSVDPLSKKYPFYTPYQFASNSPILSVDIDGLESNTNLNPVEGSFTSRYVRSIFKNIVGFDPGRPGPFTTVADPRIGSEDLLLMTMPYRALAEMLGGKKFEETELGQHAKAYGDAVLNGDPDALGNLTADALQLAFAFSGARQQYKQNLAVFDGDAEKFTLEWNKGARQFKISNEASVKNTVKVPKAAAVEGHEGMEFLDDNLRMKEQPFSAHFVDRETVLTSANVTYKGSTTLAHSLSKHSNRHPQRWGTLSGPPSTWHEKAMKHFDDIMNADGPFIETLHDGRYFLEKRLPDGRGIRLNMDKTFKTFIDPKNE